MMEPAKTITELCGGAAKLAEYAECSHTRALRFGYPKDRGGTDGRIPTERQETLLRNARAAGIDLRPEHFFGDVPPLIEQPTATEVAA